MAHVAITIEGGLFSADLLERLGSRPEEVPGQRPTDFGLDGARLSEEIQATFSDVQRQWQTFEGRSARHQGSATSLTRDLWMLPVLRLLGYDLEYQRAALHAGGGSFTISHVAGEEEGAPPVHIVAHDQELDRRGDARQSPHALVQDYLNRSDCLWGVVTNGRKLRLLRDSKRFARPTYVEFDLEAMVAGNLYSEFVVLFRLAHRSRLPRGTADAHESWLERYYQQGIAEGGRVRERLSEGVHQALLTLGSGFLAHPDSAKLREAFAAGRMDETEYYRQLLRLVYRLLFLMVAEERRLLLVPDHENAARQRIYTDWYSITRLRQLAERRFTGDRHSDLFEGLKQTFLLFRDEKHAAMLGLTALDGELFGPLACAELEAAACRNKDLLRALFHLSTFEDAPEGRGRAKRRGVRRRVNYAGLDVEELGSVYQGLLEYHPQVDRERWTFDLVAGSERKQTGSYYTPRELVAELIDSALVPVMEERLAKATTPEAKERALLDLKVVDPAAGSGHFLLAAARRIGKELARVRTGEPEPAPEAQRAAIRDVVRHCLYAVDKNPLAVDLCKVALWIEGHNTGRPLSFLDHHVKCGDSLTGVFDLKVLEQGIPDNAYKPLTGDDKDLARELKRRNRLEREGQETLGLFGTEDLAGAEAGIARAARELEAFEDDSPATVHEKGRRYREFRELHSDFRRLRQACDLWTAAFFAKLEKPAPGAPERIPTTDHVRRALRNQPGTQGVMKTALELSQEHRFFHWPLEFAEVFAAGGFDVALGNPPFGAESNGHARKLADFSRSAAYTASNSAADFLVLSQQLLRSEGIGAFVMPKSLTYSHTWRSVRRAFVSRLLRVVDVSKAWKEVLLEQVLITYRNRISTSGLWLRVARLEEGRTLWSGTLPITIAERLDCIPTGMQPVDIVLMEQTLEHADGFLSEFCRTQRGAGLQKHLVSDGDVPVISGKDIAEFRRPIPKRFLCSLNLDVRDDRIRLTSPPQAIFQNLVAHITVPCDHIRIIGTIVHEEMPYLDTVNSMESNVEWVSPYSIAGLLMSDLINWFVYTCIYNRAVRTMHFDNFVLEKIPAPRREWWSLIAEAAGDVESSPRLKDPWIRLNETVYDAYGISAAERAYVSRTRRPRWDVSTGGS